MLKNILEPIEPLAEQHPIMSNITSESKPEKGPKSIRKSKKPRSQAVKPAIQPGLGTSETQKGKR